MNYFTKTNLYNNSNTVARAVMGMKLNQAVSMRLKELLQQQGMTQYRLNINSGVPKSTIGNIVNCTFDSVKLRVLHELCQGLNISLKDFFHSPLFDENNLEP